MSEAALSRPGGEGARVAHVGAHRITALNTNVEMVIREREGRVDVSLDIVTTRNSNTINYDCDQLLV